MEICVACGLGFVDESFRSLAGLYCSERCMPDGTLDERGALSYTGILAQYRELAVLPTFERFSELDEKLSEIAELRYAATEYLAMDDEVFYYGQIQTLYDRIDALHSEASRYFTNESVFERFPALDIFWTELPEDRIAPVKEALVQRLSKEERQPLIMYNEGLEPGIYDHNFLCKKSVTCASHNSRTIQNSA